LTQANLCADLVAALWLANDLNFGAALFPFFSDDAPESIHGGLVVAWGLAFYEAPEQLDHFGLLRFKLSQKGLNGRAAAVHG
jgi:hypothetical protein